MKRFTCPQGLSLHATDLVVWIIEICKYPTTFLIEWPEIWAKEALIRIQAGFQYQVML